MNNTPVRGPILTNDTTLAELQRQGAERLSDVPLNELLEFVRQQLSDVTDNGTLVLVLSGRVMKTDPGCTCWLKGLTQFFRPL